MAKSLPVLDTGITGIEQDGSNAGIIKSKLEISGLVKVPVTNIDMITSFNGTAQCYKAQGIFSNSDGTGSSINMATDAGLGTNISTFHTIIYGKIIGVRYRRNNSTPPFSIVVDGIPFDIPVRMQKYYFNNNDINTTSVEREALYIIPHIFQDTAHSVRVLLHPNASQNQLLVFCGFVCEKRVGYQELRRLDCLVTPTDNIVRLTLTNIMELDSLSNQHKGVKTIRYYNYSGSNATITLTWNSTTFKKITLATTESYELNLSDVGMALGTSPVNIKHQCSVDNAVNYIIQIEM